MTSLADRLSGPAPLLLDGATGTELERRGVGTRLPLWSAHALLEAPDVVQRIHADYAAAGADVLTANTFRTQRRTLARGGLADRAAELTRLAVELALRASAERSLLVAGSAPPVEDCYRPDLTPTDAELDREHAEHAAHLAAAGVHWILCETHPTIREAVAAARAARATGLDFGVSLVCWDGARLISGEPLERALALVAREGPCFVGVNCLPPSNVAACLPALRGAGRRFGVYANLGAPDEETGFTREELAPEEFAAQAEGWIAAGARVVGGCCGTTPAHVHALAQRLRRMLP